MTTGKEAVQENKLAVVTTVPGFMTSAEIISKLRQKYHGMVYDVSTTKGMAAAIEARKELRTARIALVDFAIDAEMVNFGDIAPYWANTGEPLIAGQYSDNEVTS